MPIEEYPRTRTVDQWDALYKHSLAMKALIGTDGSMVVAVDNLIAEIRENRDKAIVRRWDEMHRQRDRPPFASTAERQDALFAVMDAASQRSLLTVHEEMAVQSIIEKVRSVLDRHGTSCAMKRTIKEEIAKL